VGEVDKILLLNRGRQDRNIRQNQKGNAPTEALAKPKTKKIAGTSMLEPYQGVGKTPERKIDNVSTTLSVG